MRTTWLPAALIVLCACLRSAPHHSIAPEIVAAHNSHRSRVGTPRLIWSDALAAKAQQWANALIQRGEFMPRPGTRYGENLFEISNGHATPGMVVDAWMSERANYDYRRNSCSGRCGHYTQVIWRDTELVGCGVARNARREVWVCDYDPPGNIRGERPY